jgi:RimJ/RimL family protein N-acetyltransferase
VISLISPENRRSIRVAECLGETLQGRIPDHFGREMLCYGIERERYRVSGAGERIYSARSTTAGSR